MWKNCLITFNASKPKLVTFHHYLTEPEFSPIAINGCLLSEAPCHERLYWDLNLTQISSRTSLKMLKKWSVPCTTPVILIYLVYFYKSQMRTKMEMLSLHFLILIEFKKYLRIVQHRKRFAFSMEKCSDELYFLVPPVLTFTAKTSRTL